MVESNGKVVFVAFVDPNGAVDTADKLAHEKREHYV
jgi:hypothetical protein